ncbi:MAG: transcriptional repressor, partial [Acidimicrobiales bacterium]
STADFARFELAEDRTDHHHHPLICSQCGHVAAFTVPPEVEEALAGALGRAAEAAGFVTQDHRLDLIGQCRRCA